MTYDWLTRHRLEALDPEVLREALLDCWDDQGEIDGNYLDGWLSLMPTGRPRKWPPRDAPARTVAA